METPFLQYGNKAWKDSRINFRLFKGTNDFSAIRTDAFFGFSGFGVNGTCRVTTPFL